MNINLHIQAIDGDDLRRQLRSILGDEITPGPILVAPVSEADTAQTEHPAETEKPKATRTRRSTKDTTTEAQNETTEPKPEQESAEGESGSGVKTVEPSAASDAPATSSSTSTSAATTASAAGSDAPLVTIDTIRELTLSVVDKRGKEGIEAVLSEFGVQRSTQVPEAQWGELVAALRDALED